MKTKIAFVVPVRLDSERFPNKVLSIYKNFTILDHVFTSVYKAKQLLSGCKIDLFLATDTYNDELKKTTDRFGAKYFYSNKKVSCGSERIKLVYQENSKYDYYISFPADEPEIQSEEIVSFIQNTVLDTFRNKDTVYTLYCPFFNEKDLKDPRSCKMVIDQHRNVLYTSRAIVPGSKNNELHELEKYKKHVGVFMFPKKVLKKYVHSIWHNMALNPGLPASMESLEQNMFVCREFQFKAYPIKHIGFGIDGPDQIAELEQRTQK